MSEFIYKPPKWKPQVQNATLRVKFSQGIHFLDPWGFMLKGKTRSQRIVFRLKHPIAYTRRWFFKMRLKMRRIFFKDKIFRCNLKNEIRK